MATELIFNNLTEITSIPSSAKMLIVDDNGKVKKAPISGGSSGDSLWESGIGLHSVQTKGTGASAEGECSVAEGINTVATSAYSHAEGYVSKTVIDPNDTLHHSYASHAEGVGTVAKGAASHAEGDNTIALGMHSHSEGRTTTTGGEASHAEGSNTITNNFSEHAEGRFNVSNKANNTYGNALNTQHSVGIGDGDLRKNAFEIMQNGDAYLYGVGNYDGTNPSTASTLQSIVSNVSSGLITVSRNSELEYDESENAFQSVIESTTELQEYFTTPGKYNLLVSIYGNADMGNTDDDGNPTISQSDVCSYMANHFCCLNASGLAIAQCYDMLEYEGTTTHFTSVSFDTSENKCYVTYQGLMGDAKLLASENAKISIYLQKLW